MVMEYRQNTIVIDPPARQAAPITLQITALVFGIVSFVLSLIDYFVVFFGNIMLTVARSTGSSAGNGAAMIVLTVIVLLLSIVGIILSSIGLVRSIRPPRTVKGIVFSAVGLSLNVGGLIFALICLFINGLFSILLQQM